MGWVCILNPSIKTFEESKKLLANAYNKAEQATIKKLAMF
jgi:hypothetical protein